MLLILIGDDDSNARIDDALLLYRWYNWWGGFLCQTYLPHLHHTRHEKRDVWRNLHLMLTSASHANLHQITNIRCEMYVHHYGGHTSRIWCLWSDANLHEMRSSTSNADFSIHHTSDVKCGGGVANRFDTGNLLINCTSTDDNALIQGSLRQTSLGWPVMPSRDQMSTSYDICSEGTCQAYMRSRNLCIRCEMYVHLNMPYTLQITEV